MGLVVSSSRSKEMIYKVYNRNYYWYGECGSHISGDGSNLPKQQDSKKCKGRKLQKKHALKISDDSHNYILDEIIRRERLDYDPSRVLVGDEDEDEDDSDSDSDSE